MGSLCCIVEDNKYDLIYSMKTEVMNIRQKIRQNDRSIDLLKDQKLSQSDYAQRLLLYKQNGNKLRFKESQLIKETHKYENISISEPEILAKKREFLAEYNHQYGEIVTEDMHDVEILTDKVENIQDALNSQNEPLEEDKYALETYLPVAPIGKSEQVKKKYAVLNV